jgi:hypothetical protein
MRICLMLNIAGLAAHPARASTNNNAPIERILIAKSPSSLKQEGRIYFSAMVCVQ